jgi:hypothetical protein
MDKDAKEALQAGREITVKFNELRCVSTGRNATCRRRLQEL